MIEWNSSRPQLEFEVKVGHTRVVVQGATQEEAISNARKQLSREMPRMWDVIHNLDTSRFDVTCRNEN
jgi:hypothetical protein